MNNTIDFQIDQVTALYSWERVISTTTTSHGGFLGLLLGDTEHTTTTAAYCIKDVLTGDLIESNTDEEPPSWTRPHYSVNISGKSMPQSLIDTLESLKGLNMRFNPKYDVDIARHTLYGLMVTEWDESTNTGKAIFEHFRRW